jgi:hypothetical protein
LSVLLLASAVQAATYTVGAAGDYATIQAAIAAAGNGDTIQILDAVHTEQGIAVNKSVTIEGLGAGQTIVQAHANEDTATNRVFSIAAGQAVTIRDMTVRHGKVVGDSARAGGIDNLGTLTLVNVVVTLNRAVATDWSDAVGGGIYSAGTLSVVGCTISANMSMGATEHEGGRGGGIINAGTANVVNTTICGNFAGDYGGGCFESDSGMTLVNCTVSHNSARQGGGLMSSWGLPGHGMFIKNTIVSDNTAYTGCCQDIDGTINSLGYNLIRDVSAANGGLDTTNGSNTGVGNVIGEDPLLGALADNGGPTPTRAVPANSPAVDQIAAGTNGMGTDPLDIDQCGVTRPQGSAGDIGAYEYVPVAPTVTTAVVSNVSTASADGGGEVTADGGAAVTARGLCWNTAGTPTIASSKTSDGTGTGTFTSSITGLLPGTTYHLRAYATNSAGTSYGDEVTFTTTAVSPTVITAAVTNVSSSTATCGGLTTTDGGAEITARGVCWNTTGTPTIGDSKTSNGTGIGVFTSNLTGLSPGMTYHVRAYATNSIGTSYGDEATFTTAAIAPSVATAAVSSVTPSAAVCGGEVTATGGANVTARGVCWNTGGSPTVADSKTANGTGTGAFSSNLAGLSPSTTYYVRAYATNSAGTSYGQAVTFTTAAELVVPEDPADPPASPSDPEEPNTDPPPTDEDPTHPVGDPDGEGDAEPPTCGWGTIFPWMLAFTGMGLMRCRRRR